jgi:hypothetical protein
MRLFRLGVSLLLVLALVTTVSAAGKGKKKGTKPVRGVVVSVQKDDGKDTGTITVRVQQGKKKAAADTPPVEKKFTISDKTKIEKITGKKGQKETTAAKLGDVTEKSRVIVKSTGDAVDSVSIVGKAKKNKAS